MYRLALGRVAILLRDVSERYHAAEAGLRASEERLRLIVEGARDYAIFTTDPEGRIDAWLPGAAAVFGWSAEEAVGQSDAVTFTPEDRDKALPRVSGRLPTARAPPKRALAYTQRRHAGLHRGGVAALRGPDGQVTWLPQGGRDVTARKAAEDRRGAAVREVEHRARNPLAVVSAARRLTRRQLADPHVNCNRGTVHDGWPGRCALAADRWTEADRLTLRRADLAPDLRRRARPRRVGTAGGPRRAGPRRAGRSRARSRRWRWRCTSWPPTRSSTARSLDLQPAVISIKLGDGRPVLPRWFGSAGWRPVDHCSNGVPQNGAASEHGYWTGRCAGQLGGDSVIRLELLWPRVRDRGAAQTSIGSGRGIHDGQS